MSPECSCSVEGVACSVEGVACSVEGVACSVEGVACSVEGARAQFPLVLIFDSPLKSVNM